MEPLKFDATFADCEDTLRRFRRASKAARRMRQRDIRMTAGASAVGLFLVILSTSGGNAGHAVTSAAIALAVVLIGYPRFYDWLTARRTRQFLRDSLGAADRFPIEIHLDQTGVHVKAPTASMVLQWDRVNVINDLAEGVEFVSDDDVVMARSRAFPTPESRAEFLARARSLVQITKSPNHQINKSTGTLPPDGSP